jgi:hypothetical protein
MLCPYAPFTLTRESARSYIYIPPFTFSTWPVM